MAANIFYHTIPIHGFGDGSAESAIESFVEMLQRMASWAVKIIIRLPGGTSQNLEYPATIKYDKNLSPNLIGEYTVENVTYHHPLATMTAEESDISPTGYIIDLKKGGSYGGSEIDPENTPYASSGNLQSAEFLCYKSESFNSPNFSPLVKVGSTYQLYWDYNQSHGQDPKPVRVDYSDVQSSKLFWEQEWPDSQPKYHLAWSLYAPTLDVLVSGRTYTRFYPFMSSNNVKYYGWIDEGEITREWKEVHNNGVIIRYFTIPRDNSQARFLFLFFHPYISTDELKNHIRLGIYSSGGYLKRYTNENDWTAGNVLDLTLSSYESIESWEIPNLTEININVFPDKKHIMRESHKYYSLQAENMIYQGAFYADLILSSFTFTFHAGHGMGDEKCCCCECKIDPEEEEAELYEVHVNFTSEVQISSTARIQQTDIKSEWEGNTLKLWLKDGGTITVLNIPIGTEYNIEVIQPEEYDECDKREYNIEPSSGTVGDYDPETGEGGTEIEASVQTGETVQQYLDRLRQRGYEQLAENLKLENVEFTLQDERIKLGDLVTVDLPEFDFKAVVRVTGVKLKSQGNQTIRTISVGTPLKILRRSKI